MSLYAHIARKEDLLDLMVDEVASETLFEGGLPEDWREAITAIAHREREVALAHPWSVDLRTQRPRLRPNGLKHIEQSLAALGDLGLDPLSTWRVATAVDEYVLGHAVSEVLERGAPRREGSSSAELQVLMRPYFQRLVDSGEFPNLAPILKKGLPVDDNTFDRGLDWMLDGIADEFARHDPAQE
jgi:AcrR family transcriptional regulator